MIVAEHDSEYAVVPIPGYPATVRYSVPLFRDIEFTVNDHYRRIPHGGIENGGLLYGTATESEITIKGFAPIECEHAVGPTFTLSVSDIHKLMAQIREPQAPDMSVLGWFISHSRGELVLTEVEALLAHDLFPSPLALTVLVKPQKFKATRFGFLARDSKGQWPTEGEVRSMILPLPTPSAGRSRPLASESELAPVPEPRPADPAPAPDPSMPAGAQPPRHAAPTNSPRQTPATAPRLLSSYRVVASPEQSAFARATFWLLLLLCLPLLGLAAYGFYAGAVPNTVSIAVKPYKDVYFLSWPAAQTRSVDIATLQVNGAPPVLLSESERASGTTSIRRAGQELRIELIAHHWLMNAHGTLRIVSDVAARR